MLLHEADLGVDCAHVCIHVSLDHLSTDPYPDGISTDKDEDASGIKSLA